MRAWWRVLIVWLLVLALPVQGAVASAVWRCAPPAPTAAMPWAEVAAEPAMPCHEAATAATAVSGPHARGAHGAHGALGRHGAAHAAVHGDAASAGPQAGDRAEGTGAAGGHGPQGCSACAACAAGCAAHALPARLPPLARLDTTAVPAAEPQLPAPSFITAGPERPPRATLV